MFETLYRVDPRGKSFTKPHECEYYQPRIDVEHCGGKPVYFVRETHGYFDDTAKRAAAITQTFNPDEPFETFAEAEKWYQQQLQRRAADGFVHVFGFDPFSPGGMSYRRLK